MSAPQPKPQRRMARAKKPILRTTRPAAQSKRPAAVQTRAADVRWSWAVRERDGHRCQRCGHPGTPDIPLDAHHALKGKKANPSTRHSVAIGIALCRMPCHRWAHDHPAAFRAWYLERKTA